MKSLPSQHRLNQLLYYDSENGSFWWREDRGRLAKKDWVAGHLDKNGYIVIVVDGVNFYAHRLAYIIMTGKEPPKHLDHHNGIRSDNRWCNLREATRPENGQNRKTNCNSSSGYIGVSWDNKHSQWRARISINNNRIHLGYFDDPKDAYNAYLEAKQKYHNFQPIPRENL